MLALLTIVLIILKLWIYTLGFISDYKGMSLVKQ